MPVPIIKVKSPNEEFFEHYYIGATLRQLIAQTDSRRGVYAEFIN
jgi:hypothetical protein